jgi:hypothetical protein
MSFDRCNIHYLYERDIIPVACAGELPMIHPDNALNAEMDNTSDNSTTYPADFITHDQDQLFRRQRHKLTLILSPGAEMQNPIHLE